MSRMESSITGSFLVKLEKNDKEQIVNKINFIVFGREL